MIPVALSLHFFLYAHATDLRKSFDGLSGLVIAALQRNPTSGDVYVFLNRRRDRMKLLRYDELMMILEGIDLNSIKRRRRYHRSPMPV